MLHSISIHRYTLRSKAVLNARSVRNRHEGALIRVDFGSEKYGYGCIHPWVELGDLSLDITLEKLAKGEKTNISERALFCAQVDSEARVKGVSLFDGLDIPESHATLVMDSWCVMDAVDAGFLTVKLKVGKSLVREAFFVREQAMLYPSLRWRFDFNHTQSLDSVSVFLGSLGDEVIKRIDFLEDACLPNESMTECHHGVPMAMDHDVESAGGDCSVMVIKPAVHEPKNILKRAKQLGKKVIYTSYMDHPVGQVFAAWEAAHAYQTYSEWIGRCGLVTHGLFENDEDGFINSMGSPRPYLKSPKGTGLGFDDLLGSVIWERLI